MTTAVNEAEGKVRGPCCHARPTQQSEGDGAGVGTKPCNLTALLAVGGVNRLLAILALVQAFFRQGLPAGCTRIHHAAVLAHPFLFALLHACAMRVRMFVCRKSAPLPPTLRCVLVRWGAAL